MSQLAEQNLNEIQMAGGYFSAKPISTTSTLTGGALAVSSLSTAGIITGANTTPGKFYGSVSVATQATTAAVNVIGATVGFACTLTSATFYSTDDANGTITLAGGGSTIATFTKGSNNTVRTATLASTLASSATLTITNTATSGGYVVLTFTVV